MLHSKSSIGRSFCRLCLLGLLLFLLAGSRARATVYYVSPAGSDTNSGTSWASAMATVNAANSLAIANDQIWVAAGTYTLTSTISLNSGVALYGGFKGTETLLSQRNYVQNVTILDGNQKIRQIITPVQANVRTRVDGFTFQNANSQDVWAQGDITVANNVFNEAANGNIYECIKLSLTGSSSAFVLNNQIKGILGHSPGSKSGVYATDDGTCTVTITGNTFRNCANAGIAVQVHRAAVNDNTATNCGNSGIWVQPPGGSPGNIISINANTATDCGQGLSVGASYLTFTQNSAQNNTGLGISIGVFSGSPVGVVADNVSISNGGGGLNCSGPMVIKDNLIANNTANIGAGLYLYGTGGNPGSWTVANNTIVDNVAGSATGGGGIYLAGMSNSYTYSIANNVVAFNSSGIDTDGSTTSTLTLTTNDVFGSDNNNYDGLQPGATDISLDPLFVDHTNLNYHLASASPCIDAGTDSFVASGDTDLDGNPRIYGVHVDIGGYEWTPSSYPSLASLAISPTTLCSGQSTTGLVTLTSAALPAGAVVQLSNTNPSVLTVPSSVTVAGGSTSALFTVTANGVTAPQTTVVSATYLGITQSVTVTVNPLLASFTLSPSVVIGGATVTGTITLNGPITSTATVTLTSGDASVTVPASVSIPAGSTSATFTATTAVVTTVKTVALSASDGVRTINTTLTVDPVTTLKSLGIAPSSVTGGLTVTGVVTLTGAAPAGGVTIPITSNNASVASAPATVTVAAGKRSVDFLITTSLVTNASPVTFSAALGSITKTAKLTVAPATIASVTLIPSTVEGGENSYGIVTLSIPALTPVTVTLAGTSIATPDLLTVVIPAGSIQVAFDITTSSVTKQTTAAIKATAYGVTKSATLTLIP